MKRITLLIFVSLFALSVSAQNKQKVWAIGGGLGLYDTYRIFEQDDSKELLKQPHFDTELYLSRFISPSFDFLAKPNFGIFKEGLDFVNIGLDLRYKITKEGVQPYILAGPAVMLNNSSTGLGYDLGLGIKFPLKNKEKGFTGTSLYLEAGYFSGLKGTQVDGVTGDVKDNIFKITIGIERAFFGDKDGDGVRNNKDECPGTPLGCKVDAKGCPFDSDFDGVLDCQDECPNTPKGCKVDTKGCPIDSDGDGIMDCADDCPNAAGPKEFKGCPDTDGDGVIDKNDECPNTPKGCKVDAKGCPLDRDKDGVIDCEDDCPDEFGVKELKGCPVRCKDFEINNVQFDFDKADLKPEGIAVLDAFVANLGDCKEFELLVNGHTCNMGPKKHNLDLSEERAQSVVKYLASKGINVAFVTGKGYGEEEPAVPNTNKANREQNRRAVIDLIIK